MTQRTPATTPRAAVATVSAAPPIRATPTSGEEAEAQVFDRLRHALPAEYRLYRNWRWVLQRDPAAPTRDGESDLVIVHPEHGFLVLEVKAHLRRDGQGRWFAGERLLPVSPVEQAETGKHALRAKLIALDGWSGRASDLRLGHAIAVPSQDLAATRARVPLQLGADVEPWMVLDQTALESDASIRQWVADAYAHWNGDGRRGAPLTTRQMALVESLFEPAALDLLPSLRIGVDAGEREVRAFDDVQQATLDLLDDQPRAAIVGSAGTGKTVLAMEKARRLATNGRTLLVCFNAPLARQLIDAFDGHQPERLDIRTFHELCLQLGQEAGTAVLPSKAERGRDWWEHELPDGALDAISALGARYRAIVVDEGQDFDRAWLELLQLLLIDPGQDPFIVFHDPLQALYRAGCGGRTGSADVPAVAQHAQLAGDPRVRGELRGWSARRSRVAQRGAAAPVRAGARWPRGGAPEGAP